MRREIRAENRIPLGNAEEEKGERGNGERKRV